MHDVLVNTRRERVKTGKMQLLKGNVMDPWDTIKYIGDFEAGNCSEEEQKKYQIKVISTEFDI